MIINSYITSSGAPAVGLTPTIRIWMVDPTPELYIGAPNGTYSAVDLTMTEVGDGFYNFEFTNILGYNTEYNYLVRVDGAAYLDDAERYQTINISPADGLTNYTISDQVWDEQLTDHTNTGTTGLALNEIKANTASILISELALHTMIETILKYNANRTRINTATAQLIIYDDDGTTPIQAFDLKDFNGMPSIQEICERVPTI